jgi:hypothetical protein
VLANCKKDIKEEEVLQNLEKNSSEVFYFTEEIFGQMPFPIDIYPITLRKKTHLPEI